MPSTKRSERYQSPDGRFGPALRRLAGSSILILAAWLPSAAWAEGAVRLLDCTVTRVCSADGDCKPGTGRVSFRMEPVETDADGSGRYALSYGDVEADMRALSAAGPFFWTLAQQRNTLIASSDTQFLWHELELEAAPEATVRFLTCTLSQ